jgi:hypothetical protein
MEEGAFTLVLLLEESILKGFKKKGKQECVGMATDGRSILTFFALFVSIMFKGIRLFT